ncbi:MAG: molybdopterin-dependent oxidoreductase [Bacteroidota bacterium]
MKTILTLLVAIAFFINGNAQSSITVSGEVKKQLKLTLGDLAKYPQTEVKAKDKEGKEHMFKGVALSVVLDSAGVTLGKNLRGENLAKYVLITAADKYTVVYALAEIDPEFASNTVLLCTHVDGNLLPKGEGPFRLVNPIDKRPARWIREIVSIKVGLAKN